MKKPGFFHRVKMKAMGIFYVIRSDGFIIGSAKQVSNGENITIAICCPVGPSVRIVHQLRQRVAAAAEKAL